MKRSLKWRVRRSPHEQGAAAVLAMMFLVIFSSLAAAMAIVSQGNLQTADAHVKISRSLAAAETGLQFLIYRMNQGTGAITTDQGVIDEMVVEEENLWRQARDALMNSLAGDQQYQDLTFVVDDDTGGLSIPSSGRDVGRDTRNCRRRNGTGTGGCITFPYTIRCSDSKGVGCPVCQPRNRHC